MAGSSLPYHLATTARRRLVKSDIADIHSGREINAREDHEVRELSGRSRDMLLTGPSVSWHTRKRYCRCLISTTLLNVLSQSSNSTSVAGTSNHRRCPTDCVRKTGVYSFRRGVKKPLNPILGEIFTCYWDYPDHTHGYYIAEQTSHHPPKSSYFFMAPAHHIRVDGTLKPRSRFLGNSAASLMEGISYLRFTNRGSRRGGEK